MPHIRQFLRLLPLLVFASILSGASLACTSNIPLIGRTITPSPTVTPTSTETPTATPTFTPSKTPTPRPTELNIDWPVVLSDSFNDNSKGWLLGNWNDEFVKGTISVSGGKYRWALAAKQGVYYWSAPGQRELKDFYVSVDVEKTSGYTDAGFGLIFRVSDQGGYFFTIDSDDGNFQVDLAKDGWSGLKERTASDKINSSGVNRIAVLAEGSSFTFYINGVEVCSLVNGSLPRGIVGLGVVQYTIGESVDIEFDNFEVRAPR